MSLRGLGVGAEHDQKLANALDGSAAQLLADFGQVGGAGFTIIAIDADLDKLVCLEGAIDFFKYVGGETISGDAHDRIKVVGTSTEFAADGRAKFLHVLCFYLSKLNCSAMKPSKTSKTWMQEHLNDPWVHKAKAAGYRARAAFKLLEIDNKDHLIKPGMVVVDLGSAPGSWSQIAGPRVKPGGETFALDILPMEAIPDVTFLQGDFREESVLQEFEKLLAGRKVDLVLSDMAPNMSGNAVSDDGRMMYLAELALEFSRAHLRQGGNMLIKVFQGSGFMAYRAEMQETFQKVVSRKPEASRDRSAEVYLLGLGRKA